MSGSFWMTGVFGALGADWPCWTASCLPCWCSWREASLRMKPLSSTDRRTRTQSWGGCAGLWPDASAPRRSIYSTRMVFLGGQAITMTGRSQFLSEVPDC